jgi:hypothetical protein
LSLINTLFSARIQDLFGSGFRLTSKDFELVFVSGSIQPTKVDPLGLIFHNYLNICKPNFWHFLSNNTFKFFSLMCKRDSCIFFVLEQTKSDLSKINWLLSVIRLHSNSVGFLGQVFIMSHSYQTSFDFSGLDLNLDCGLCDHMITRFASQITTQRLPRIAPSQGA